MTFMRFFGIDCPYARSCTRRVKEWAPLTSVSEMEKISVTGLIFHLLICLACVIVTAALDDSAHRMSRYLRVRSLATRFREGNKPHSLESFVLCLFVCAVDPPYQLSIQYISRILSSVKGIQRIINPSSPSLNVVPFAQATKSSCPSPVTSELTVLVSLCCSICSFRLAVVVAIAYGVSPLHTASRAAEHSVVQSKYK